MRTHLKGNSHSVRVSLSSLSCSLGFKFRSTALVPTTASSFLHHYAPSLQVVQRAHPAENADPNPFLPLFLSSHPIPPTLDRRAGPCAWRGPQQKRTASLQLCTFTTARWDAHTEKKSREDASSQEMQRRARESSCVSVDGAGTETPARHAPVSAEEATALVLQVPTSKKERRPKEREGAASEMLHLVAAITLHWK